MEIVDKRQCCFKKLIWSDVNLERGGKIICQNKLSVKISWNEVY